MRNTLKAAIAAAILPLTLAGCATFHGAAKDVHLSSATIAKDTARQIASRPPPVVRVENTPYLLGRVSRISHSQGALPKRYRAMKVSLATAQPLTLMEIAAQITQQTGLPIHVAQQVQSFLQSEQMAARSMGGGGMALPSLPGMDHQQIALPNVSSQINAIPIHYSGSLDGLLNMVAAQSGAFWKYRHGQVRFFLTETRTFAVDALPGTTALKSSISNAGSNGGSAAGGSSSAIGMSGATSQSTAMNMSLDIYKYIQTGVNTVLAQSKAASGGGGGISVQVPTSAATNPATGQVIVTATPPELRAVAKYLRTVNDEMRKNVLVSVHVFSVVLNATNNYNLNLKAVFNNLGNGFQPLGYSGPKAVSSPAGEASLSGGIIAGPVNVQAVASALATQGDTSLVTSQSVITLNGQPAPIQVAKEISYLASSTTTQTAQVGSSTSLTPGTYTPGFSGTVLPLVRGRHIILQVSLNLTQDEGLKTFTSNGSSIELPQLATQSFVQEAIMRSGQTMVLSRVAQTNGQINRGGVGASWFWGLGGGAGASRTHEAVVAVIRVVNLGGGGR